MHTIFMESDASYLLQKLYFSGIMVKNKTQDVRSFCFQTGNIQPPKTTNKVIFVTCVRIFYLSCQIVHD